MIVHDFKSIAARANLRALDGRPQTEDKPRVGAYVADYSALTESELSIEDSTLTELWANNRTVVFPPSPPVEMPCDSNPQEDWYAYAGFSVRAVDDLSGYTAPAEDCA